MYGLEMRQRVQFVARQSAATTAVFSGSARAGAVSRPHGVRGPVRVGARGRGTESPAYRGAARGGAKGLSVCVCVCALAEAPARPLARKRRLPHPTPRRCSYFAAYHTLKCAVREVGWVEDKVGSGVAAAVGAALPFARSNVMRRNILYAGILVGLDLYTETKRDDQHRKNRGE